MRGIQLLLRVQHIQVDAHAHFVSRAVGFHRRPAGLLARFQRLDTCQPTRHAGVILPRGLNRLAARGFEIVPGLLFQLHLFGHLRRHAATRIQRNRQHHAHRVVDRLARRGIAHDRVAGAAAGGAQVQGGIVAALGDLDLSPRDAGQQLRAQHFQARRLGLRAPVVDAGGLGRGQLHGVGQLGQCARR
ncbi:hypothetical protein D3C86_1611090 [compost metagenome]